MQRLLTNVGPLVHLAGEGPIVGKIIDESQYVAEPGLGILIEDHTIIKIAPSKELQEEYTQAEVLDLEGKAVIPGLVDSHTHLLWTGDRSREVSWKQQGLTYSQISELGGGIGATVAPTRGATKSELAHHGIERMRESLRNGTTHLEAKSAVERLPSLDLTWMGAHASPIGGSIDSYAEEILSEQLPAVIEQGIARSADIFCEPGWFSLEQSEDILKASRKGGLDLRMHIDEFVDGGGGELASELKVVTADHAHYTNDDSGYALCNG